MYDVIVKFTNGDEMLVPNVYEVQAKLNSNGEITTFSENEFCSVHAYSNFSYSFIGKNRILTALGSKVEYLIFKKD